MSWTEVFLVFALSHIGGDFLLQTEWQALNKIGGLGPDPVKRRALLSHVLSYMVAFIPALIWLADDVGGGATFGIALLIGLPHLVQDDGRLRSQYIRTVKRTEPANNPLLDLLVDQGLHMIALFLVALLATS